MDEKPTRQFLPNELVQPDGITPTPLALDLQQQKSDAAWEKTRDEAVLSAVNSGITLHPDKTVNESLLALGGAGKALAGAAINATSAAFGGAESVMIDLSEPDDPNFKLDAKTDAQIADLPKGYADRIRSAGSQVEFDALEAQVREVLADREVLQGAGASGAAAQMAAGIVDLDALLIPLGGSVLGRLTSAGVSKVGLGGTRLGGMATGLVAGAEAGLMVGVGNATMNTTGDAGDIPSMVLGNMALGGVIGGATKMDYSFMDTARKASDEYYAAKANNFTMDFGKTSASAGAVIRVPKYADSMRTGYKDRLIAASEDLNAYRTLEAVSNPKYGSDISNPDSKIAEAADKLQWAIDQTPMKSLFSDIAQTGLIGSKLSHDILSHPAGLIVNNQTGALYKDVYHGMIAAPMLGYRDIALAAANRSNVTIKDKLKNTVLTTKAFKTTNRNVMLEMERRWHNDPTPSTASKEELAIADMLDKSHALAVDILKGKAGETPVRGSEDLQPRSGYITRKWLGEEIQKHTNKAELEAAMRDAYYKVFTQIGVPQDVVDRYVKMIMTRSVALADGVDTNLVGLLRTEGKEFLRETMLNNGMATHDVDSFINALTSMNSEKAKLGNLKDRIDLDLRVPVGNSGKLLIDFIEQDVHKLNQLYAHRVSGAAALARKGIQRGDIVDIEEAIVDEARARGRKDLDGIRKRVQTAFSYYGAGPVGGGVSPELMSILRLTRMSLLGTAGIPQMGELGGIIATNGWEAVSKHLIPEAKAIINGTDTKTAKELNNAMIVLNKDHILFNHQLALDVANNNPLIQHELMDGFNKVVAYGERIHGYTSLLNHSMSFSQNLAAASTQSKIYNILARDGLTDTAYRRMLDNGLDTDLVDYLKTKVYDGTIIDTPEGVEMNFKEWDADMLQQYRLALHKFTAQQVMKGLAGEMSYWQTTPMGRILGQLRTFPLLAMQKQFLRHMKHADSAAVAAVPYTLLTGGLAYAASQTVKGNTQNLTAEKIAKGAINYSSQFGWMPMAIDPMLAIMGMDEYQFNGYNPYGNTSQGVIPLPPVFPVANNLARLPVAMLGSVNGIDPKEAKVLSFTPILGSMYGFGAYFNAMKHE